MTHRSADRLSDLIDHWLSAAAPAGRSYEGHLSDVLDVLGAALPGLDDGSARERVRRRLSAFTPRATTPSEILLERAGDSLVRLTRSLTEDEYLPLPALAGAAVVIVGAVFVAAYLRRRGLGPVTGT